MIRNVGRRGLRDVDFCGAGGESCEKLRKT